MKHMSLYSKLHSDQIIMHPSEFFIRVIVDDNEVYNNNYSLTIMAEHGGKNL